MTRIARPILLIDVDGVISLFGFTPYAVPAGRFHSIDGIPHLLSATAGRHLTRLADDFELVWCTGWEEKANEYLPQALKLPGSLPWLSFDRAVGRSNAHWKLAAIDAFAGAHRALAWIDDALDERCHAWAAARPGPTLLVDTDPSVGLTDHHVSMLTEWAASEGAGRL